MPAPDIVLTYDGLLELLPSLLAVTDASPGDCGWQPGTVTTRGRPA